MHIFSGSSHNHICVAQCKYSSTHFTVHINFQKYPLNLNWEHTVMHKERFFVTSHLISFQITDSCNNGFSRRSKIKMDKMDFTVHLLFRLLKIPLEIWTHLQLKDDLHPNKILISLQPNKHLTVHLLCSTKQYQNAQQYSVFPCASFPFPCSPYIHQGESQKR